MSINKFGCSRKGKRGATGPAGETGPAGPMGPIGPQGKRGVYGAVGVRGPKGDTGLKGEDGTMGQTGPQGKRGADGPAGSPGKDGSAGKDAFNLIQWSPNAFKRIFRESASVNIYFNSLTDGIVFKERKPIGLKNRGLEGDANFIGQTFPRLLRIKSDRYMIELKNSIFKIDPISMGTTSPTTSIFALSFKSLSISEEPRILFSSENGTRAISLQDRLIEGVYRGILTIYSSGVQKEIRFNNREWAGLLIQYTCIDKMVHCQYMFNEQTGTLDMGAQDKEDDYILYIGGHPKKSKAHHAMGSFEMYYNFIDEGDYKLSKIIQKCLVRDILDRIDQDEKFSDI